MYETNFNREALEFIYNEVTNHFGEYKYIGPDYSITGYFYELLVRTIKKFNIDNEVFIYITKIDDDEYDEFCDKLEHRTVDLNILPYD